MEIENSFTVDAPIEEAWALLTDIPEIAPCLPGAKLDGESEGVYSGSVKVKVGPVTAEYKGTAEFVERDDAGYKAVISGKGRDSRGAGNAQALITAQMTAVGAQTTVDINTDLKISGKVAQFGRGVMQDVSEKLLGQFAECLAAKLGDESAVDEIAKAGASASASSGTSDGERVSAGEKAVADSRNKAAESGDDVVDLFDVAGGVVLKRLVPVAVAAALVIVLIRIFGRRPDRITL